MNPRDKRKRKLNIARASIKLNNVSWQRLPGTDIAHLRIALFSDGEAGDLRKALLEIKRQGIREALYLTFATTRAGRSMKPSAPPASSWPPATCFGKKTPRENSPPSRSNPAGPRPIFPWPS